MAGVVEAVGAKLLGEAIAPAAKQFFSNLGRSFAITRLHHGDVGLPGPVQDALRAVRLEFGRDGQLTERFDAFLTALAGERMFDAIFADAFFRTRNEELRMAFLAFYARYFPEQAEKQAGLLYREIQNIAAVYVDHGLQGSSIYFLFREDLAALTEARQSKSNATLERRELLVQYDALRATAQTEAEAFSPLISIDYEQNKETFLVALKRLKPWFFVPDTVVTEVYQRYRIAVLADTETVDVFGPRGRISAPFDQIYVKPDLEEIDPSTRAGEPELVSGENTDPDALLAPGRPCVVLGHPGVGKTSVSRYVVRRACRAEIPSFAVVIELRKYLVQKKLNEGHSLIQHALDKMAALMPDLERAEVRHVQLYSAFLGRITFVYDGLDEVLNIQERAAVAREIARMAADYPRALHLATSRLVGYERAPVRGWHHHRIRPFDRARIAAYVRRATEHIISVPPEERDEFVSKFLDQASRTAELAEVPLLLALMTVLFNERGHQLPDQRHEIYEECAKLLFMRWDETREILPELADRYRLSQLLNQLAAQIYNDKVLQAGVSREWLEEACGRFFTEIFGGDRVRGVKVGIDFAEYVTDRAWVFTKTGTDSYEFTHRTFLEYYYSEHISEDREGLHDLLEVFAPKIKAGQMTVVAHLCLQRYVRGSLTRSDRLVDALRRLLEGLPERDRAQVEVRVCNFIAEAVDYLAPGEAELRQIIETLTSHASATVEWRAALYRVLRRARNSRGAIFDGVIAGLAQATRKARGRALASVYDYLYAVRLRRGEIIGGARSLPLPIVELADAIESAPEALTLAFTSGPASLKLQWDCFGRDVEVDRFVFQIWASSVQVLERADWLGMDAAVLLRGICIGDLSPRQLRLVASLGEAVFAATDLQRFPTGRTVYWGRIPGLDKLTLTKALETLSNEHLKAYAGTLAVLRDYQQAAQLRGGGDYVHLTLDEMDVLIERALDLLDAAGVEISRETSSRLRDMEPKVIGIKSIGRMLPVEGIIAEQTLFPWLEDDSYAKAS